MQVGEEDEPLAKSCVLERDRLLDLEQELGLSPDVVHAGDARPGGLVRGVGEGTALARTGLDHDVVAALHELARARRRQRDAVFVGLDLLRDADLHGASPYLERAASVSRRYRSRPTRVFASSISTSRSAMSSTRQRTSSSSSSASGLADPCTTSSAAKRYIRSRQKPGVV